MNLRAFATKLYEIPDFGPWWTFKYTDSDLSVGTYGHHQNITALKPNFNSLELQNIWSLWAVQIHLITIEVRVVGVAVHLCFLEVYPQSRGNNERRHSIHYPRSNTANILKEVPDKNSSLQVWWPIFITSGRTLYKLLHDFAMKTSMTCFVSTKRFEKNLTWLVVTIL